MPLTVFPVRMARQRPKHHHHRLLLAGLMTALLSLNLVKHGLFNSQITQPLHLAHENHPGYPVAKPELCPSDQGLLAYVRENGGFHSAISVQEFNSDGARYRGLGAAGRIKEGQVVLKVPLNISLSALSSQAHPVLGPLAINLTLSKEIDEFALMAVVLLLEARNVTSAHRRYMCSLPRTFSLPTFWPPERVRASLYRKDMRFLSTLISTGRVLIDMYLSASARIFDPHPEIFPTRPSFDAWRWASSVIMSRTWGVHVPPSSFLANAGVKHMHVAVPVADLLNHRRESKKVRVTDDGWLVLEAAAALQEGDEITITYGNKCNSELLNSYGFDVPGNNVTVCELDLLVAPKADIARASTNDTDG